jgi:biopolymer transport protein ExbD
VFYRRQKDELTLNLTPLIDVVFLLLIFFMVSTSFSRESQLALSLPNAEGQQAETDHDLIEISIDANGVYFVNGTGLVDNTKETLVRALVKLSAADKTKPIVISADAKANYQAAITAMDAAGIAGFSNLSLATREGNN